MWRLWRVVPEDPKPLLLEVMEETPQFYHVRGLGNSWFAMPKRPDMAFFPTEQEARDAARQLARPSARRSRGLVRGMIPSTVGGTVGHRAPISV